MDRPRACGSQSIDLSTECPLRIGKATIDPKSREAKFPGGRERLQPQNLKVLIALARRKGHVVTRTDLIDLCWDGRIVGDDVINGAISHLRKCLAGAGFTIETIPKSGYRLVAIAEVRDRKRVWALAALPLAAVAGIIIWLQRDSPAQPEPPTVALVPFTSGADRQSQDIAAASSEALSHMLLAGTFAPRLDWPATAKTRPTRTSS
jgi:DNA-binding winged helix-turn-helix (wHTH) protein